MTLQPGKRYALTYPDGSHESIGVISFEGNGWYKVQNVLSGDVFFLNLNMVVAVAEFA